MRIPSKVKIGAMVIPVKWVKGLKGGRNESIVGMWDEAAREIKLNANLRNNDGDALDTLIHESLHAMNYAIDLQLSEDCIRRLAFMLAAFLVDNKLLKGGGQVGP